MFVPALESAYELVYEEGLVYVYEGIRRQYDKEEPYIKRLKRRYRKLMPLKQQILSARSEEQWRSSFSFLYPYLEPLFVSDLVKKRRLTRREQQALIEKVDCAERLGIHPDCVIIYTHWEAY